MAATGVIPWLVHQLRNTPGFAPAGALDLAPGTNQTAGQALSGAADVAGKVGDVASHGLAQDATSAQSIGGAVQHALYNPGPAPASAPTPAQTASASNPTPPSPNSPTGALGPGAQIPSHVHTNDPLTYQQIMNASIGPLIKSMAAQTSPSAVNAALAPYGNTTSSVGENIAHTLSTMTADYQQGLTAMLKTAGEQTPTQAILKGMEALISYPVSGLTGQQGAPAGVEETPFLQQLYATLNNQRSGIAPTIANTGGASSGYNTALNTLLAHG